MVIGCEIIPIGTLLSLVSTQVLQTALAARDVLIEKESFDKLSRYLLDIEPVIRGMQERCFRDSAAAKQALDCLKQDLERAGGLVKDCQDKSKFYLLLNCRSIVKNAEAVTRDIGKDLELLSLAGTELSHDVRENLQRLTNQFMSAEYQACEAKLQILDKVEQGIQEHKTDQGFANDLLIEIARTLGIPVEASEISKELSSFKKEKERLAADKARQEEQFMEQVIILLMRADAAYTSDVVRQSYMETLRGVNLEEEPTDPLVSFYCPLMYEVMMDPVTVSSNQTYERKAVQRWFADGNKTDPVTGLELVDFSVRPNNSLRRTIKEWMERNYCIRIRKAKRTLEANDEKDMVNALEDLYKLCYESSANKEWIAAEGLIVGIVHALKLRDTLIKRNALTILRILVEHNINNREELVSVGGLEPVVRCLGTKSISKTALLLLVALLQTGDDRAGFTCERLCQEKSAILYLVMLQNDEDAEAAKTAKLILEQLCDKDENIVQMAAMTWLNPLIARICKGGDRSRLVMAQALGRMDSLSEQNKRTLGEGGVIPPLITMIGCGSLEAKAAALGALKNLSSHAQNQQAIVKASGFPILMKHLTSPSSPLSCKESAAVILRNVSMGTGAMGLADTNGAGLDLIQTVETLLNLLEAAISIRAHVLQVLLGMTLSPDGSNVQDLIRSHQGIELLLKLLEGSEREVRDSALQLLSCLSERGGPEIAECLIHSQKLDSLVRLLDSSSADVQAAAAAILGNLPADKSTTEYLMGVGALPALLLLIQRGSLKVTENALSAMSRFADPTDLALQKVLVDLSIHPLLVTVMNSGTVNAKAKAAEILKNFSVSTQKLSIAKPTPGGWFCFTPATQTTCKVHRGVCTTRSTFCIVESEALPGLVALLDEPSSVAAEAGMGALLTLVSDKETSEKGALFLHEVKAIDQVITLLSNGSAATKEKALQFLECIFVSEKMRELYDPKVKIPLVELASKGALRRKAAKILAQLSLINGVSSYY